MDLILNAIKKIFGETAFWIVSGIILGVLSFYFVPKYIVTMETFAGEKQQIYNTIDKGDYWQELRTIEMEMRSLQQQKWQLEDRIDSGQSTVRDLRRLEVIEKQLINLEQRKIQIRDALNRKCY